MTPRLVAFIRLLRTQGLRLSVAESLDALHSVSLVGVHDRELLRLTLRTALVKAHQDFTTFDALFERFFTVPRRWRRRRGHPQAPSSMGIGQRPTPQHNGLPTAPVQPTTPPTPPGSGHRPAQEQRPETPDTGSEEAAQAQALQELADLEQAWHEHIAATRSPQEATWSEPADAQRSHMRIDRPFPPDRLADMYREVERLAARLLSRQARRTRRAHAGRFDIRRTVVRGLRSGTEVPFTLAYRRRKIGKLRLIVLCDVSGSVWQVSTFLLKLVHTMQSAFASVRSLVFVNSVVEVTELFRRMRFPDDLESLRHYPQLNLFGFSDFGRVFYQFSQDFLSDLRRDTVVLILGDARNNAFDPQAWTLGEVRQHCRRIIWLNPELLREWNTGDSIIATYAPFCDQVLECWTLEHLAQAADVLLQA
jgi:uncharacterized protein with von Willebrand factor type A (vWA) domain